MAHKKAGKHREENWEDILTKLSEEAEEEMHEKVGLILEALEMMESSLVEAGTILSHLTYSGEFWSFYAFPWEELSEEIELFVSPEEDGYTYRCWVSPVAYRDGDEFVFLYRDDGKELETYMDPDGWVLVGEPMEGIFEEEEDQEEEEEVLCQVADMVDAFMDDQEVVGELVLEKVDLLKELLFDAKTYLEEKGEEGIFIKVMRDEVSLFLRTHLGLVKVEVPSLFILSSKAGNIYDVSLYMEEEDEPEDGFYFGFVKNTKNQEKMVFPKIYNYSVD